MPGFPTMDIKLTWLTSLAVVKEQRNGLVNQLEAVSADLWAVSQSWSGISTISPSEEASLMVGLFDSKVISTPDELPLLFVLLDPKPSCAASSPSLSNA